MIFSVSVVTGLLLGLALLLVIRRARLSSETPPVWIAWLTLGIAVVGALAFALGLLKDASLYGIPFAIFMPVIALVIGADALIHKDRRWQIWLGFILGLAIVLFWAVFAIGEIAFPH